MWTRALTTLPMINFAETGKVARHIAAVMLLPCAVVRRDPSQDVWGPAQRAALEPVGRELAAQVMVPA